MTRLPDSRSEQAVAWQSTPSGYAARVDGEAWSIAVGDYPEEPLYTLSIEDVAIASFYDWPAAWKRVEKKPADQRQRLAQEYAEIARIEA